MPKITDFTVTVAGLESAFKLYSNLADGTVSEATKLAIGSSCTEATYKLWFKFTDHEKADALVLFLDPIDSKSYIFLMARVEQLLARKIPVILIELISAAGAAIDYRAMPHYKVLVKKFAVEEGNRIQIRIEESTQAQLDDAIYARRSGLSHASVSAASGAGASPSSAVSAASSQVASSASASRSPGVFGAGSVPPPVPAGARGWFESIGLNPDDPVARLGFNAGLQIFSGGRVNSNSLSGANPELISAAAEGAGRAVLRMLGIESPREVVPFVAAPNPINRQFEALQKLAEKLDAMLDGKTGSIVTLLKDYIKKLNVFSVENKCPITSEIMAHPVYVSTDSEKIIFDRESLRELLRRSKVEGKEAICPMTRTVLTKDHVLVAFSEEDGTKRAQIIEGLTQLKIELEELDLAVKAFLDLAPAEETVVAAMTP